MNKYKINDIQMDSIDLKCMLISRGVKVHKSVYKYAKDTARLSINPLCCNCVILSDGTVAQLTDTQFHLQYLSGILSWDNLKLLRHVKDLATPFSLRMENGQVILFYDDIEVDEVSFPPPSDFYKQKTSQGRPFVGNAVMQGLDWVAFQCLWPCELAIGGQACEFCFSGGDFETRARKGKAQPDAVSASDVFEMADYAFTHDNVNSIQITGGSTHDENSGAGTEAGHIIAYLTALKELAATGWRADVTTGGTMGGRTDVTTGGARGETLLYITPPADTATTDRYFELGASRIGCSIELWDKARAKRVTPGKINLRDRYLQVLEFVAEKYGTGKSFSNFIIGIEEYDTLAEGATWMAERGILPTASIWMPMGRPVMGSMKAPKLDYYKRVKELFAGLYSKYNTEPPKSQGLNVCIERDIWELTKLSI